MRQNLEELLALFFQHRTDERCLEDLPSSVWQEIEQRSSPPLLRVLLKPKFQLFAMSVALLSGLTVSTLFPLNTDKVVLASVNANGLNVFSASAFYLPSALLTNNFYIRKQEKHFDKRP